LKLLPNSSEWLRLRAAEAHVAHDPVAPNVLQNVHKHSGGRI
jgi:hypothetical protein